MATTATDVVQTESHKVGDPQMTIAPRSMASSGYCAPVLLSETYHQAYRERNRIEQTINCLKQFRRIATRYEKRAVNHL